MNFQKHLKPSTRTDFGVSHNLFWHGDCRNCAGSLQLCEDRAGHYLQCVNCARSYPLELRHIRPLAQSAAAAAIG